MDCPNCGVEIVHALRDSSFCPHDEVFYYYNCCHGIKGYAGKCPLFTRWASRSHFFLIFYGSFGVFLFLLIGVATRRLVVLEGAAVIAAIPALVALGGYALFGARRRAHERHEGEVRSQFALRTDLPLPPLAR